MLKRKFGQSHSNKRQKFLINRSYVLLLCYNLYPTVRKNSNLEVDESKETPFLSDNCDLHLVVSAWWSHAPLVCQAWVLLTPRSLSCTCDHLVSQLSGKMRQNPANM